MGLFKTIFSLSTGIPMRLTTGRERSRRYQREANDLLEEQLDAMQNLAQPQTPSDTRPRGTCPACLEMMLRGASTCPHCHTTGITWPQLSQQPVETKEVPTVNTKKAQSNNTKETGSVAKVFTWFSILSLLAGAFWVTTNFPAIMALAAAMLTLLIAGGNHPEGLRGWVAWCLGAVLNGLWFVFTFAVQEDFIFEDGPHWNRFLNFPALVVVESIILMVVILVVPDLPRWMRSERPEK